MASMELDRESLGMDACVGVHQAQKIEHLNTQWVIGLVQSGGGEIRVRRDTLALAPGDCLIVPPGVTSLTHWQADSEVATLFFWPEQLEGALPTQRLPRAGVYKDEDLSQAILAFSSAFQAQQEAPEEPSSASGQRHHPGVSAEGLEVSQLALLDVLGALEAEDASTWPGSSRMVRTIRDFLHAEYSRNVSLDELASRLGRNKYHLHKTFRSSVGVPPHAYLMQLRIERAKLLLARGWPVIDVAIEVGFYDQSHFTKAFRKAYGTTPGAFAKAQRAQAR